MKKTKKSMDVLQVLNNKHMTFIDNTDFCISCGAVVSEGRMICWACENQLENQNKKIHGIISDRQKAKKSSVSKDLTVHFFKSKNKS